MWSFLDVYYTHIFSLTETPKSRVGKSKSCIQCSIKVKNRNLDWLSAGKISSGAGYDGGVVWGGGGLYGGAPCSLEQKPRRALLFDLGRWAWPLFSGLKIFILVYICECENFLHQKLCCWVIIPEWFRALLVTENFTDEIFQNSWGLANEIFLSRDFKQQSKRKLYFWFLLSQDLFSVVLWFLRTSSPTCIKWYLPCPWKQKGSPHYSGFLL